MRVKKVLTFLLALIMALTLLPTGVWAVQLSEAEPQTAVSVMKEAGQSSAPEPREIAAPAIKAEAAVSVTGPDAKPVVMDLGDGLDADPAALTEDDGVFGTFEIVFARRPDGTPKRSVSAKPRGTAGSSASRSFSGSGTASDPWKIVTADDLAALAATVNAGNSCAGQVFSLTNDLSLLGVTWTPIGYAWDITFNGTFLGNGHTISDLSVESTEDYIGLFGCLTGTVDGLTVRGDLTGGNYVGGIAGCSYGTINQCGFTGSVRGGDYVGGIAGCSGKDASVRKCSVNAAVDGAGSAIGGVVGWANNIAGADGRRNALNDPDSNATGTGLVEDCSYQGTLTGRSPFGVGVATSANGTITITVTDNAFGGIVGWNNGCVVRGCVNDGTVNADDFAGGIVGDCTNGGVIESCTNRGIVNGASMLNGGIAGRVSESTIGNCTNTGKVTGGDFTGGVVGAIDKYSAVTGVCTNGADGCVEGAKFTGGIVGIANCAVSNCINAGSVSGTNGVGGVIGWTIREVLDCRNDQTASVVGTGEEGRIGGVVGNAYGLVENCSNKGSVEGAANVGYVGGVVGYLRATLKNGQNTGSVTGGIRVGGVAGGAFSGCLISGCTNDGPVSGESRVGGVVGEAVCLVSNCANLGNGTVTGSDERIGGVIGYMAEQGKPEHLRNEGAVNGNKFVGGVIGLAAVVLNGAVNEGEVSGTDYVGGVAGSCVGCSGCVNSGTVNASNDGTAAGGIAGSCGEEISGCENTGTVSGGRGVGGIVGLMQGEVKGCTNAGGTAASNGMYAGGIAGFCNPGSVISDCENSGSVSCGDSSAGGIVGYLGSDGGVRDCRNTANGTVTCEGSACGGIVGQAFSPVANCTNAGTVNCAVMTGGIAGEAQSQAAIDHCTNLTGSAVSGTMNIGGIVGTSNSPVTACENEAGIAGTKVVGGIIGSAIFSCTVSDCRNSGEVAGESYVGGIAGTVGQIVDGEDPSGLIENCVNQSSVSGGSCTGGIAGAVNGTIKNCENTAGMTGTSSSTGGITGFIQNGGLVSGCANRGAVTAGGDVTGGIAGTNAGAIENCVNHAVINGNGFDSIGGIAGGSAETGTVSGCTNKAKISGGRTDTGGIAGSNQGTITGCSNAGEITNTSGTIGGIAGETGGSISNCANTGMVSTKTEGQVYAGGIAGRSYGSVSGCTNSAEIKGGEGLGGIVGIFSNGGSITDCSNSGKITAAQGAAGGIVGGLQRNCKVLNCSNIASVNASGKDSVGGIIGVADNNNTVTNCTNSGSVTGNNCVGGIVGENGSSGTYSKLTNTGTVTGNYDVGGIAGDVCGTFSDCLNSGSVSGTSNGSTSNAHGAGGVIGRLTNKNSKIERCKNAGTVSGTYFIGGIVGVDSDGAISNSLNEGYVSSRITSAGDGWVGGIAGYVSATSVTKCVNHANVGTGQYASTVGGIAGSAANVLFDQCRNYSTITGKSKIGGIAGFVTHINDKGTTIQRCINTGHVTSNTPDESDWGAAGGIVGNADHHTTVNECANNNPNAKVQTKGRFGGGIAGVMYGGTIKNSYNTGYVFAKTRQGGIVGEFKYHCTMETCFNFAGGDLIPVNGSLNPRRGALVGEYDENAFTFTYNYYSYYMGLPPTGKVGAATASSNGHYDYFMVGNFGKQSNFKGFDFTNVYTMQSDRPKLRMEGGVSTYSDTGPTSTADPVPTAVNIYTVQDLENFRNNVNAGMNYSKTTVNLCSDLDMSGVGWVPIGTETSYFNGIFNGQGHAVYNLTVSGSGTVLGLFGAISGKIQNLEVHGSVTQTGTSASYVGGLVGANVGGTVEYCSFFGDVKCSGTGGGYVGGLAGLMNGGTIHECYHVGAVSGATASAGLVSYLLAGTLKNCYHYTGQITGTSYAAGIAAINGGTVQNCFALSGTATTLFSSGTGSNVAFKPAKDFLDTTLINAAGWGASWLVGDPSPEIPSLCYGTILYANDGTATGRICGVRRFRGTLLSCPFTRDGYTFLGWNTQSDGSGDWYEDCGSVGTPDSTLILFAQWLKGTPYHGYSSENAGTLLDNNSGSIWSCSALERGGTSTVTFTANDAVRPCAIAFRTTDSACASAPGWYLEAKVHESDGEWTLLASSDGAPLGKAGRTVYARLDSTGDDYYSFYRIVFQGPSAELKLSDAYLMVADADADVRRPLKLHSNNGAGTIVAVDADNGAEAMLANPFILVKTKYLLGWNTAADGSGVSYANYATITVDGATDLYAQWLEGTHYRRYTALKAYDQTTPLENGVPQNDPQYLGYDGQEYGCLVDDDVNTKWCVSVRTDAYWSLEFSTDAYVTPIGYVLMTSEDSKKFSGRNPKNWTLEGLSPDGTWVMLDGILKDQSLPAANNAEICRTIGNEQAYCTYRITFHGLGRGSTFQLSELYLITDGSAREPVVSFDSHGGTGSTASVSAAAQTSVQVPANGFTREGYDFTGWNTAQDGSGTAYAPGDNYLVSGDATLYAQWTPKTHTVKFLGENGETLYETTAASGQLPVYKGNAPVKEGNTETSYAFAGWTPVIVPVNSDATYTVRFETVSNLYNEPVWSWSEDHSTATASFTSITEPGRVETVQTNEVSVKTTPATCTANGKIEYSATVTFLGVEYTGVDTIPVQMLGHAYTLTGWTWTGYTAAKATFTCGNDASHVEEVNATITSERTEPTCEGEGKVVYTAKVTFEGKEYTDTKTETLDPSGHAYRLTGWTWTGYTAAKATFTCDNNASHVQEVNAAITSERTEPTCEGDGKIVYTAKVTFEGKDYTDTKTEILNPAGHTYSLTGWTWTGYTAAKATFTCGTDTNHVQEVDAAITSERTEPTCEGEGRIVYTAKITFEGKDYTDTKTETLDPSGHAYRLTGWTWTGYTAAKTTFTCDNDASHVQEVNAAITSERTEPTCEGEGKIVYTAKATFEGKEYTDTKTETLNPAGHAYTLTGWTWTGYTAAKATFTCGTDANHVQEADAAITSERTEQTCEGEGRIVYTARVTFEGKEYTDTKTETLDPSGHAWDEPAYVWSADNETVTASAVCRNDPGHVRTETVTAQYERTQRPTFDSEGKGVYTATFTDGLFTEQTKEVTIPAHSVNVPTGLTAIYGQTLADIALPDGWVWDDPLTTEVGNAGDNTFSATFTLTDDGIADSITKTLTVSVKKAKIGPEDLADDEKPKAVENLIEEAFEQALVIAPGNLPDGYTRIEYSSDGENWTDKVPTGKEAGSYTVRVRYAGDANHEDFEGTSVVSAIAKAVYVFAFDGGEELIYTKNSGMELTATVIQTGAEDTSFEHFAGIKIGSAELQKDVDYTVRKGSTIVTILPAALDGLDVGDHTLTVRFTNGEASTRLTVRADDEPEPPRPGDDSRIGLWIILMAISTIAAASVLSFDRKKNLFD